MVAVVVVMVVMVGGLLGDAVAVVVRLVVPLVRERGVGWHVQVRSQVRQIWHLVAWKGRKKASS